MTEDVFNKLLRRANDNAQSEIKAWLKEVMKGKLMTTHKSVPLEDLMAIVRLMEKVRGDYLHPDQVAMIFQELIILLSRFNKPCNYHPIDGCQVTKWRDKYETVIEQLKGICIYLEVPET